VVLQQSRPAGLLGGRVGLQSRLIGLLGERADRLVGHPWEAFWAFVGHPVPRYPTVGLEPLCNSLELRRGFSWVVALFRCVQAHLLNVAPEQSMWTAWGLCSVRGGPFSATVHHASGVSLLATAWLTFDGQDLWAHERMC
jgi:hypothetical protein